MPKPISVLIPMNGLGDRFRNEGYYLPKPLINVLGKPMLFWLLDNLNLSSVNEVIIPYTSVLDGFDFQTQLRERYKNVTFRFFPMNYSTRGAAETVFIALDNLPEDSLDHNIMLLDCDTFYFDDIIGKYQSATDKNHIFYFNDTKEQPIYSYIDLTNGRVTSIAEKEKISDNANCGVYCFESGSFLKQQCKDLIDANETQKAEFYISGVYKRMLSSNDGALRAIGASEVSDFHCVGTPMQLKIFCETYPNKDLRRFCFDLDSTLVTKPRVDGDYTTCDPIERNINFLKHLKSLGHYIIIYTARRMRTHGGNTNAVVRDIGLITLEQLKKFDIPYDEIQFGKPWAHYYIDDLAVNCNLNLEKQIGYYNSSIKSRNFNKVEVLNSMVIKSGAIEGERYYYKELINYPEVSHLFPKLLEETDDKIILERAQGLNFSYLYTNGGLTEKHLMKLMDALGAIHTTTMDQMSLLDINYAIVEKIKDRYASFNYSQFHGAKDTYQKIVEFMEKHKPNYDASMIHGDPVFTNVILTPENTIKMIDMRGKVGDTFTVGGDLIYDLAKVYQSITGYDFIMANAPMSPDQKLHDVFVDYVKSYYKIDVEYLRKYTAGLYFSLIPLHNDEKCQQYYAMARKLISEK